MSLLIHPSHHHARSLMQHVASLFGLFDFDVDRTREPPLFIRQTLLDPIPTEAQLLQQR